MSYQHNKEDNNIYVNINEEDTYCETNNISKSEVCCDLIVCIIFILLYSFAISYFMYMIITE